MPDEKRTVVVEPDPERVKDWMREGFTQFEAYRLALREALRERS